MNQKSSLREVPQSVSQALTANKRHQAQAARGNANTIGRLSSLTFISQPASRLSRFC
jgi:hypothetical protein